MVVSLARKHEIVDRKMAVPPSKASDSAPCTPKTVSFRVHRPESQLRLVEKICHDVPSIRLLELIKLATHAIDSSVLKSLNYAVNTETHLTEAVDELLVIAFVTVLRLAY